MRQSTGKFEDSLETPEFEPVCDCQLHGRLVMIALFGLALLLSVFIVTKLLGQQPQASMQPAPELTQDRPLDQLRRTQAR